MGWAVIEYFSDDNFRIRIFWYVTEFELTEEVIWAGVTIGNGQDLLLIKSGLIELFDCVSFFWEFDGNDDDGIVDDGNVDDGIIAFFRLLQDSDADPETLVIMHNPASSILSIMF